MSDKPTHAELVSLAAKWLKNQGCSVVITEMTSASMESPDAIGWQGGFSILVECKTSRADYLRDQKKHFRRNPRSALGLRRFYMAPEGMLSAKELPVGWGLLSVKGGKVYKISDSTRVPETTRDYEIHLLVSAIRRMVNVDTTGVACSVYVEQTTKTKPRATVEIVKE